MSAAARTGAAGPRQIPLPLAYRPAAGRADFLVSDCNANALAAVEGWRDWPRGALALSGPARSGKTHLAHVWRAAAGARIVPAGAVTRAGVPELAAGPLAVEDAPAIAGRAEGERALLHLVNLMAERRHPLMLTGRGAPAGWGIALPDLASRLEATALARIAEPDDALLAAVLAKHAADRRLALAPGVVEVCVTRMERSFAAAERLVAALDAASLAARRPVTQRLAREILDAPEPPA